LLRLALREIPVWGIGKRYQRRPTRTQLLDAGETLVSHRILSANPATVHDGSEPDAHPAVVAFGAMVAALDRADYREATRLRRELFGLGFSVVPRSGPWGSGGAAR